MPKTNTMTDLEKQVDYLGGMNRQIAYNRNSLIENMRRLGQRLLDEAAILENKPDRVPDSSGYVGCTSLSATVDTEAARLAELMRNREMFKKLIVGEETLAAYGAE